MTATGWGERGVPGRRRRVAVAVALFGVALAAGGYLVRLDPLFSPAHLVRVAGGACLLVAGVLLFRVDREGHLAVRVATATVLGVVAVGLVGGWVAADALPPGANTTLAHLDFAGLGAVVGFVGGVVDARREGDARRRDARSAELRRKRDEYRALVDGLPDAVVVHDARGRIRMVNEPAVDRLGADEPALRSRRLGTVEGDPPDGPNRWVNGDRFGYDAVYEPADSDPVPVTVSARLVRHGGGPAVACIARDRRDGGDDAREELAAARDQLTALNRVVRHDVRNDMQVILGLTDLLGDHVDETGRDYLETIAKTGKHVVGLAENAREVAQTIGEAADGGRDPVPLAETVRAEVERRRNTYGHATFVVEDLPRVDVLADGLLSAVVRNLLNNAVQHNDREEPTVRVRGRRDGEHVVIEVADDGPGIADERKEAVFGEAECGVESDGSGLGLHLVATLVERYGGAVWAEDNDPRGTVVVVRLPVAT